MSFQGIKRIFSKMIVPASLCAILASGCETEDTHYLPRVLKSTTVSLGAESTNMNKIRIPEAYENIPPHPDDLNVNYGPNHPCKTRKVNLKSGSFDSGVFTLDVSPIPYGLLENIKIGYKGTFPLDVSNQIREGLSKMEWYEYGAYAGTYSRIKLPDRIDSLRISWLQQSQLNEISKVFVQPGISCEMWNVEMQGGWDRNHEEQPMLRSSGNYIGLNPFIAAGVTWHEEEQEHPSLGVAGFCELENINGNTPYGHVKLEGITLGLEAILAF
jgi:hypothetical protein